MLSNNSIKSIINVLINIFDGTKKVVVVLLWTCAIYKYSPNCTSTAFPLAYLQGDYLYFPWLLYFILRREEIMKYYS